jgi:hypothetical protein
MIDPSEAASDMDNLNIQSRAIAASKQIEALYQQGRYQESLDVCLRLMHAYPGVVDASNRAAANCIRLGRWQDAIDYVRTGLARSDNSDNIFGYYDMLALAHGQLKQWDMARRYGLQALDMRDRYFGGEPVNQLFEPGPMPPLPSAQTREHNIIAFSLFGNDSKYCEPAVLNVQEQPRVYPHWVCRFYVDNSVPESVITRLRKGGAQIIPVQGPALQWPGPMWRLLALDAPLIHRVLFRDADSVVSRREARAVEQWLSSGKRFHVMRDDGSHTELIMAGLWGVVADSLPPLELLMQCFMRTPPKSRYFADQDFLRQYVWPYARTSLMQHDSVFGFMGAAPFPDQPKPEGFHVGYVESSQLFTLQVDLPNGSEVIWEIYWIIEKFDNDRARVKLICSYPAIVKEGAVSAHIPERYVRWIQQGTACVRWVENTKH